MADFLTNLWEAVFTAGPTPTLLLATNATFAALQVVFLVLLIGTYSVHFVILSVLCGGLWWSINWFAGEILAAQAAETEAERLRKKRRNGGDRPSEPADNADDEGEDTEVEGERAGMKDSVSSLGQDEGGRQKIVQAVGSDGKATQKDGGSATGLHPPTEGKVRQRPLSGDLSSEISTDSEWEKVSNASET